MLNKNTTVPMVSSPRNRYGTVLISTACQIFEVAPALPAYSTFAIPPVAMVRVKYAHVKWRIRCFQARFSGDSLGILVRTPQSTPEMPFSFPFPISDMGDLKVDPFSAARADV